MILLVHTCLQGLIATIYYVERSVNNTSNIMLVNVPIIRTTNKLVKYVRVFTNDLLVYEYVQ